MGGDASERENKRGDTDSWWDRAACKGKGTGMWYPARGESAQPAKEICSTCEVKKICEQYAVDNGERFGIWGGKSERQRKRARRKKRMMKDGYEDE